MPVLAMLLLAAPAGALPPCRAEQLAVSLDGRDGEFNGMSHSGTELSIRNTGPDCTLVALPVVQLRDARNRVVPAIRQAPRGMHPGPVMVPVRLAAGHRAATEIRWVAGPVFPHSRRVRATRITVKIGTGKLSAPLTATLYGNAGQPATFEQTPMHAMEGMAAD
ncbi:DUF4232 domain-containing protein [Novosphingobium sp.]|uniref:DUF4232 domain-containing protein n=1 Tax=Novosphingobium sp. TaxID=1874826 RepID=UPI003D1014D8